MPTLADLYEEINTVCYQLQQITKGIPRHDMIALNSSWGDFNAKVGQRMSYLDRCCCKFGCGDTGE